MSRSLSSPVRPAFLAAATAGAVAALALCAPAAQAQTVFHACYVPASGTVYRIKAPNTPANCLQPTHVAFSWTDGAGGGGAGVTDHGALTGLTDDDHAQYLLANGIRDLNGFAVRTPLGVPGEPLITGVSGSFGAMLWFGSKSAFRVGSGAIVDAGWTAANLGQNSFAAGFATLASGSVSMALGAGARATNDHATALGTSAKASGLDALAIGYNSMASGERGIAMGDDALASGKNSLASANGTASGLLSRAFGGTASATYATSLGLFATASGERATAISGTASGYNAIALGGTASGSSSIAFGGQASGAGSLAFGPGANTNGKADAVVFAPSKAAGSVQAAVSGQFVVAAPHIFFGNNAAPVATDGRFIETGTGAYLSSGGVWTNTSDSTRKTAFVPVDGETTLAKLATLPVYSWQYKNESASTRHMGPTAQAFRAAFGLGDSDKAIATVDIDGVAIAGVKALDARTRALKAESIALRRENSELAARLSQLEALVAQLTAEPRVTRTARSR